MSITPLLPIESLLLHELSLLFLSAAYFKTKAEQTIAAETGALTELEILAAQAKEVLKDPFFAKLKLFTNTWALIFATFIVFIYERISHTYEALLPLILISGFSYLQFNYQYKAILDVAEIIENFKISSKKAASWALTKLLFKEEFTNIDQENFIKDRDLKRLKKEALTFRPKKDYLYFKSKDGKVFEISKDSATIVTDSPSSLLLKLNTPHIGYDRKYALAFFEAVSNTLVLFFTLSITL